MVQPVVSSCISSCVPAAKYALIGALVGVCVYLAAALYRAWKSFFYGLGTDTRALTPEKNAGLYAATVALRKFFPLRGPSFPAFVREVDTYVEGECSASDLYYSIRSKIEAHVPSLPKKSKGGLLSLVAGVVVKNAQKWQKAKEKFIAELGASFR